MEAFCKGLEGATQHFIRRGGGGVQTDILGGGVTLQTVSSEERLRRAPFLTDLDAMTILK